MSDPSLPPESLALFVLDQNYPGLAVQAQWPADLRLQTIREHAPDLVSDVDDWEILFELQHRGGVVGFITNDARILDSAREMVALQRTGLKLVVTDGVGHDALRATGLILTYLVEIARDPTSSAIYRLRPGGKQVLPPGRQVNLIAARTATPPMQLIGHELSAMQERLNERRPHLLKLLS